MSECDSDCGIALAIICLNSNPSYITILLVFVKFVNEFSSKVISSCVGMCFSKGYSGLKILDAARSYAIFFVESLKNSKNLSLISTSTQNFFLINSPNLSVFISGMDGSSYKNTLESFNKQIKNCLNIVYLLNSFIFAAVTSAAFLPESSIEP